MEEKIMRIQPLAPRIGILVVDDHPVVRAGLTAMLSTQSAFEMIGEASDGKMALEMIDRLRPDIVLLDLRMSDISGIDVLRSLAARKSQVRCIVLTNYELNEDVFKAVEAGARGYLLKDVPLQELARIIRAVHEGRREFPRGIANSLAERMARATLTTRELEVLEMLVKGFTNKQVGRSLGMSDHTARNHVVNILAKLDVADRTEAVATALRQGIIKF